MRPIVSLLVLLGCSGEMVVGEDDADAGRVPPGEFDECGNGFDDDDDGRIDEDPCVCGSGETQGCWSGEMAVRGVGGCRDGVQACSGAAEFGTWGSCEGVGEPGEETCEGTDEDCDGATDEGCSCTSGETRPCEGLATGACSAGEQRCADDTWGACEGSVGPGPEVCADGIDNDCDGLVDDPHVCECSPVAEVCGDGVDNDCDGEVDEPSCGEPVVDAGMPDGGDVDAGPPVSETCDGSDEDGDIWIDEGACTCSCELGAGTTHAPVVDATSEVRYMPLIGGVTHTGVGIWLTNETTWSGSGAMLSSRTVAIIRGGGMDAMVELPMWVLPSDRLETGPSAMYFVANTSSDDLWSGDPGDDTYRIVRVDARGNIRTSAPLPTHQVVIALEESTLHALEMEDVITWETTLARYDADTLTPVGARVPLPDFEMGALDLEVRGGVWVAAGRTVVHMPPFGQATFFGLTRIEGDAVTWHRRLDGGAGVALVNAGVGIDASGSVLASFIHSSGTGAAYLVDADGDDIVEPFEFGTRHGNVRVDASPCGGFVVAESAYSPLTPSGHPYVSLHFVDAVGSVRLERQWDVDPGASIVPFLSRTPTDLRLTRLQYQSIGPSRSQTSFREHRVGCPE